MSAGNGDCGARHLKARTLHFARIDFIAKANVGIFEVADGSQSRNAAQQLLFCRAFYKGVKDFVAEFRFHDFHHEFLCAAARNDLAGHTRAEKVNVGVDKSRRNVFAVKVDDFVSRNVGFFVVRYFCDFVAVNEDSAFFENAIGVSVPQICIDKYFF